MKEKCCLIMALPSLFALNNGKQCPLFLIFGHMGSRVGFSQRNFIRVSLIDDRTDQYLTKAYLCFSTSDKINRFRSMTRPEPNWQRKTDYISPYMACWVCNAFHPATSSVDCLSSGIGHWVYWFYCYCYFSSSFELISHRPNRIVVFHICTPSLISLRLGANEIWCSCRYTSIICTIIGWFVQTRMACSIGQRSLVKYRNSAN